MSGEEFEVGYIKRSGITKEKYDKHFITMSCDCDAPNCKGWACVGNSPLLIKAHNDLYAPQPIKEKKK